MPTTMSTITTQVSETPIFWTVDKNTASSIRQILTDHLIEAALSTPNKKVPVDLVGVARAVLRLEDGLAQIESDEISPCTSVALDRSVDLAEPAVLGDIEGEIVSVLLPGEFNFAHEASAIAMNVLEAEAIKRGWVLDDPKLFIEVHHAEYIVLHPCADADHSFHPELAEDGPATSGAVLATRVDLVHVDQ